LNTKERLTIAFKGLKDGIHEFRFSKSNKFFESLDYSEFEKGNIEIFVVLDKKPKYLSLEININGQVTVVCDRCLEAFYMPFEFNDTLIAKFNIEKDVAENDEVVYLASNDFEIDITHYVYESVCLSLPVKRTHPEDRNGKNTCNKQMIKELKKLSNISITQEIDPRWEVLKNLSNN
jgi:uncharacterized protein